MKAKFKSIKGAVRRVRQLEKQIKQRDELLARLDLERKLMAMLAAETPQFFNPIVEMEAKRIRSSILQSVRND